MQKYNAWKNTNLINTHIITGTRTVNTHANSLCMQDKITQTHEHTPKHDGEGTKQRSGIWTCDIHMVHISSACCGLVSIGELHHPYPPHLSFPTYLPLLYSAL